ncbi:MAG: hypothetical protein MHMPM18_000009 [Marteilia pararefringens]
MVKNCSACDQELPTSEYVDLEEYFLHLECVKCGICDKNLEIEEMIVEPNPDNENLIRLLCENCAKEDIICQKCDQKIVDKKFVKIGTLCMHKKCFTCASCDSRLSKYHRIEDEFICVKCYQEECFACGKRIKEISYKSIKKGDKIIHVHQKCCRCMLCNKTDLKSVFILNDDLLCCFICHQIDNGTNCMTCQKVFAKKDAVYKFRDSISVHIAPECFKCRVCNTALEISEAIFDSRPLPSLYCRNDHRIMKRDEKSKLDKLNERFKKL